MGPTLRIVIVEDEPDAADVLRHVLVTAGHDVEVAATCTAGVEMVRRQHPDLVLCDLHLPDADGFTFASEIRRQPELDDVAIVAISGRANADTRRRTLDTGFSMFVPKPLDLAAVRQALRALDLHRERRQAEKAPR